MDTSTKNFSKDYTICTAALYGNVSIAQKFIDAGADLSMINGNERLADDIAANHNHKDLQGMLREKRDIGHSSQNWRKSTKRVYLMLIH